MGERASAPSARSRCAARRLQPLQAPLRGRRLARPARRASSRKQVTQWSALARLAAARRTSSTSTSGSPSCPSPFQFPILARSAQEVRHALPRLRHPWEVAAGARVRQEGRRRDRRLVRRDSLGSRGRDDPTRDRRVGDRARAAVRPRAARDPARALVAPAQGNRATSSRPARGSTPTSSSSRVSTTTRRSSATATPTSSSISSTPAGTGSSRSSAWRSGSPS